MKLIKEGKTKNVYMLDDGNYMLKLKDDATGKDGVFDPGENAVGLTIKGLGRESLKLTKYFFDILTAKGIPHHLVDCDIDEVTMTVKPAVMFGEGIEVVCRFRAVGGFIKRYGSYAKSGDVLPGLIEFTLKDDERNDPLITEDALIMLNIITKEHYDELKSLALKTALIMKDVLAEKGLDLYDIKYEFGLCDGKVTLIDEISAGIMRVYKDGAHVQPMELNAMIL